MNAFLKNIATNDKGMETVEYAIITGFIVTGTIAVIAAIGVWVKTQYTTFKTVAGA
jgi:Flp pilus assembly pilin Flp